MLFTVDNGEVCERRTRQRRTSPKAEFYRNTVVPQQSFSHPTMSTKRLLTVITLLLLLLPHQISASSCQFPGEIQGVWARQAVTGALGSLAPTSSLRAQGVTYSMVTIENARISGWGECAAKHNHRYILAERSRIGGPACHRCFHILVVSPNVVVATSQRDGGCYPTMDDAHRSCPETINHHHHEYIRDSQAPERETHRSKDEIRAEMERVRRVTEQIMLYKVKSNWGDESIAEVECPISGVFTFTYERGGVVGSHSRGIGGRGERGREAMCPHPTSEMSNCPYGFGLNLLYRDCAYGQPDQQTLQCLGGWRGAGGLHYMAVLDTSVKSSAGDTRPKYRCGVYHEETLTGRIHLAFSRDSTCETELYSPTEGYERYQLTSVPAPPLPHAVSSRPHCRFPHSLQGHWTTVMLDHDTLVFKDQRNLKRYTAVCVDDVGDGEHFIVFTRTHCGDSNYNCLWLKRRSANILEYMLGLYPNETLDSSLCDADKFGAQTSWNTVAKSELEGPTQCPLLGSFVGELPDAPGYCARLHSHCHKPDAMTYVVTDCADVTNAYEQRDYLCIGEWTEGDKIYGLTYRPDTHTHECFVGVKTEQGKVFIKEAGSVNGICGRGVRPEIMGMELVQEAECKSVEVSNTPGGDGAPSTSLPPSHRSTRHPPPPHGRPPWQRPQQQHDTITKSWKPITASPRWRTAGSDGGISLVSAACSVVPLMCCLLSLLLLQRTDYWTASIT
uniref:Carboxyl-ester lipase n=1 Tax=Hirondellea gigas TaxID=1518452 RepID=A0A2P2I5V0_9CRUS